MMSVDWDVRKPSTFGKARGRLPSQHQAGEAGRGAGPGSRELGDPLTGLPPLGPVWGSWGTGAHVSPVWTPSPGPRARANTHTQGLGRARSGCTGQRPKAAFKFSPPLLKEERQGPRALEANRAGVRSWPTPAVRGPSADGPAPVWSRLEAALVPGRRGGRVSPGLSV